MLLNLSLALCQPASDVSAPPLLKCGCRLIPTLHIFSPCIPHRRERRSEILTPHLHTLYIAAPARWSLQEQKHRWDEEGMLCALFGFLLSCLINPLLHDQAHKGKYPAVLNILAHYHQHHIIFLFHFELWHIKQNYFYLKNNRECGYMCIRVNMRKHVLYTTSQKLIFFFLRIIFCSTSLHLFDPMYSKKHYDFELFKTTVSILLYFKM